MKFFNNNIFSKYNSVLIIFCFCNVFIFNTSLSIKPLHAEENIDTKTAITLFPLQKFNKSITDKQIIQLQTALSKELLKQEFFKVIESPKSNIELKVESVVWEDNYSQIDKETESFIDAGIKAMKKRHFTKALKKLNKAMELYKDKTIDLNNYNGYLKVGIYLALAYYYKGMAPKSNALLKKILLINSNFNLQDYSLIKFPKQFLRVFEEIQESTLENVKNDIFINTEPCRANILFNNKEIGESPKLLKNVPWGEHYLKIKRKGYHTISKLIKISDNENQIFDEKLKRSNEPVPNNQKVAEYLHCNQLGSNSLPVLKKVTLSSGAAYMILAGISIKNESYIFNTYLFGVKGPRLLKMPVINVKNTFENSEQVIEKLIKIYTIVIKNPGKTDQGVVIQLNNEPGSDNNQIGTVKIARDLSPIVELGSEEVKLKAEKPIELQPKLKGDEAVTGKSVFKDEMINIKQSEPIDKTITEQKNPAFKVILNDSPTQIDEEEHWYTSWYFITASALVLSAAGVSGFLLLDDNCDNRKTDIAVSW